MNFKNKLNNSYKIIGAVFFAILVFSILLNTLYPKTPKIKQLPNGIDPVTYNNILKVMDTMDSSLKRDRTDTVNENDNLAILIEKVREKIVDSASSEIKKYFSSLAINYQSIQIEMLSYSSTINSDSNKSESYRIKKFKTTSEYQTLYNKYIKSYQNLRKSLGLWLKKIFYFK